MISRVRKIIFITFSMYLFKLQSVFVCVGKNITSLLCKLKRYCTLRADMERHVTWFNLNSSPTASGSTAPIAWWPSSPPTSSSCTNSRGSHCRNWRSRSWTKLISALQYAYQKVGRKTSMHNILYAASDTFLKPWITFSEWNSTRT